MTRVLTALALAVGATACAPPSDDLATIALRSERAALAETQPVSAGVRAGRGARVDRVLPVVASGTGGDSSREDHAPTAFVPGGLAIAGGETFLADDRRVARLVEGNVEPFVEIAARSGARSGTETPPLGLAASFSGALCAVSPERGELFRIDLRTKSSTRLAAGLAHPSAAVALPDGAIAVVEAAAGRLTRVETDGKLVAIASNLSSPVALAHHAGRFLVAEAGGGRIVALGAGRPPFPVASGFSTPVGVTTDRTGRLVVADAATGGIYRVESDASRTELATGLDLRRVVAGQPVAVALAFDDAGTLLVVAPGDGTLWRITLP